MLGTVLGAGNIAMNKYPQNPTLMKSEFKWKRQIMSQTKKARLKKS